MSKLAYIAFAAAMFLLFYSCSGDGIDFQEANTNQLVSEGEAIVSKNCKVCHASSINGAPILGNKKMWAPRIKQGREILVKHAMEGYELMPAKGGKDMLTQKEIQLAVDHMLKLIEN